MKGFSITVLFYLMVAPLSAQAELILSKNYKCVSPKERREVHLYMDESIEPLGPVCKVDYMKEGQIETLWNASTDPYFCRHKSSELVEKLEESSFKCIATAISSF